MRTLCVINRASRINILSTVTARWLQPTCAVPQPYLQQLHHLYWPALAVNQREENPPTHSAVCPLPLAWKYFFLKSLDVRLTGESPWQVERMSCHQAGPTGKPGRIFLLNNHFGAENDRHYIPSLCDCSRRYHYLLADDFLFWSSNNLWRCKAGPEELSWLQQQWQS